MKCYWGSPEDYTHIALREVRRTDILWDGEEDVGLYERLKALAELEQMPIPDYVKQIVRKCLFESAGDQPKKPEWSEETDTIRLLYRKGHVQPTFVPRA